MNGEVITLIIFLCLLVIATIVMFYLGVLYGKEDEKGKWHAILLKEVVKGRSSKWTSTIVIVYPNRQNADPHISIAVGSTKPYGENSET